MKVTIIGISGLSGSGKSTLAKQLYKEKKCPVQPVQMDWFFKQNVQNLETPDAIDKELFLEQILKIKKVLESDDWPSRIVLETGLWMSYLTIKKEEEEIKDEVYIIIEGFLLFYWKDIADLCDIHYFLECDDWKICRDRRYERDCECLGSNKEEFDFWYENVVYKNYLIYSEKQKENIKFSVTIV